MNDVEIVQFMDLLRQQSAAAAVSRPTPPPQPEAGEGEPPYEFVFHPLFGWCWFHVIRTKPVEPPPCVPPTSPEPLPEWAREVLKAERYEGPNGEEWTYDRYHRIWD